jgi:hypothetical protein
MEDSVEVKNLEDRLETVSRPRALMISFARSTKAFLRKWLDSEMPTLKINTVYTLEATVI